MFNIGKGGMSRAILNFTKDNNKLKLNTVQHGKLEVAQHDQYQSQIKTTNKKYDGINSNRLLHDQYHFNRFDRELNKTLNQIYDSHHTDLLTDNTLTQRNNSSPFSKYKLPQPVKVSETNETLELTFELPFKSKIFSSVRPDLDNTIYRLTENTNINKTDYAYVVLYFPGKGDQNKVPSYLLPTILTGWMLKHYPQSYYLHRDGQTGTRAKTICMITNDVTENECQLLSTIYDELVTVPYITWDKELESEKILIKDISKGHIPANHVYSKVTTKLWIFDKEKFPYEKIILLDSDLFPLGYFDTLFSLDTPAGWLEHQHRQLSGLGVASWIYDRGSRLRHGESIPSDLTDLINLHASDINASLCVISPNKQVFQQLLTRLQTDPQEWLGGKGTQHRGSWAGDKFYPFYLLPEQNFLTQEFSGEWKSIDPAFSSWLLDLDHAFGFTFAGFVTKPWSTQSLGQRYTINPYSKFSEINNRESERATGLEFFNRLLVEMLNNCPPILAKEISQLVQLEMIDHAFDPWEPEVDFKYYSGKINIKDLPNQGDKSNTLLRKLSPDQLLLLVTLTEKEGAFTITRQLRTLLKEREQFEQISQKLRGPGWTALLTHLLKIVKESLSQKKGVSFLGSTREAYYLENQIIGTNLNLEDSYLTLRTASEMNFNQNLVSILKSLLSTKVLRVYIYLEEGPVQIVGDTENENLPLDYFCHLKPSEARILTLTELEAMRTSEISGFNISFSEPIYQEFEKTLEITTNHRENLVHGHRHYEKRPYVEVLKPESDSKQVYTGLVYLSNLKQFLNGKVDHYLDYSKLAYQSFFVQQFEKNVKDSYDKSNEILTDLMNKDHCHDQSEGWASWASGQTSKFFFLILNFNPTKLARKIPFSGLKYLFSW